MPTIIKKIKQYIHCNKVGLLTILITHLIFFSRTIFFKQIYFLDDLKAIFYPLEHVYAQFQGNWQLPQWSPSFGFGHPLLAWGQLGFFTPLHVLLRFFNLHPLTLLQISIISYFGLGLLGMFVFLRRLNLSQVSAALGAVVFTFCGFNIGHLNHVNFYTAVMILPWLLLAIDAFLAKPTLRQTAILAIIAAIIPLSGQPQVALYTLIIGALYGLVRFIRKLRITDYGLQITSLTVVTGILAFCLASFAILPLAEFLPQTERADSLPEAELYGFSYPPAHAITLLLPYYYGDHTKYWGAKNFQELSAYVGIIPLLLAGSALFYWPQRHRSLRLFALLLIIIGIAFALGIYSPVYRYLVNHKIITSLSIPGRFVFFFDVGVTLLAVLGLEQLVRYKQKIVKPAIFFLLLASITNLIAIGWHYNPLTPAGSALTPSSLEDALVSYNNQSTTPARLYAAQTLPVTGNKQLSIKPTEIISPLFTIHQPLTLNEDTHCLQFPAQVELGGGSDIKISLTEQLNQSPFFTTTLTADTIAKNTIQRLCLPNNQPLPSTSIYFSASSQDVSNIKLFYKPNDNQSVYFVRVNNPNKNQLARSQKKGRLIINQELNSNFIQDTALLIRHLHTTSEVSSARWIGSLSIASYRTFIEDFFANDRDPFNGDGIHALTHNRKLVDMSGLTHFTQTLSADTDTDPMLINGYQLIKEQPAGNKIARLYRNPNAFPKSYLVPNAIFEPDPTVIRHRLSQSNYHPNQLIYINGPTPPTNLKHPASSVYQPPSGTATITNYQPKQVDIEVNTPIETWLVLTDSYTPQWQTYLDNQPAPQYVANTVFRAAFVPAGEHLVSFRYHSPAINLATKLTLIALAISATLIIFPLHKKTKLT